LDQITFSPSCTAAAAFFEVNVAAFATIERSPATMPLFLQIDVRNKQYIIGRVCVVFNSKNLFILQSAFHV
jgi:hypothetical protein